MKTIAFAILCSFCCVLNAQDSVLARIDTIAFQHQLAPVDIIHVARIIQNGARQDKPDSTLSRIYPAGNLSDLLGNGSLALKSVGPGALSTVALRGANSMQTPILWNGVNLQNINNNTVDLSLIPVFLFDGVSVEPGSSSASWGSGAIGGVIRVNSWTTPVMMDGMRLTRPYFRARTVNEVGSFSTLMNGIQIGYGTSKWDFDLRVYRQTAENNYTFRNIAVLTNPGSNVHPLDTLEHAATFQQGFLTSASWSPSIYQTFSVRLWVQETSREIPPTMLQTSNEAVQRDYAMRSIAQWSYSRDGLFVNAHTAVIHEGLLWDAGFSSPISNTNAWTVISEASVKKYLSHHKHKLRNNAFVSAGITGNWASSEVTEFIVHHEQTRAGIYVAYNKYFRTYDEFCITLREEMIDGKPVEPVGSIWYSLNVKSWFALKGTVSHNYRIPTFNDLYWAPGGNPDLKAETGWTEELTAAFNVNKNAWKVNYSVTGYNRNVINMITWVPHASYWSPVNVAEVWSKGIEHRLRVAYSFAKRSRVILTANADYVRSTYEKTDNPNDVALGKQLIYVPAWFGGASLSVEWRSFYVTYSQQYNDLRFTTRDHLEWLPAYSIGNAAIGWCYRRKTHPNFYELNLFVRCNNVANVQYQSVAWRPMPGRAFTIGLTIDFAKELSQSQFQ